VQSLRHGVATRLRDIVRFYTSEIKLFREIMPITHQMLILPDF